MKHMTIDIRNRIEFLVGCGFNVPRIAEDIGRSPSTIRNELVAYRIASDKGHGCSNRLCARFDECTRTVFNGFGNSRRKCQPKCFETCPDFCEASCHRLARPPFVCNGCEDERSCPMAKFFYIASVAQGQYEYGCRIYALATACLIMPRNGPKRNPTFASPPSPTNKHPEWKSHTPRHTAFPFSTVGFLFGTPSQTEISRLFRISDGNYSPIRLMQNDAP